MKEKFRQQWKTSIWHGWGNGMFKGEFSRAFHNRFILTAILVFIVVSFLSVFQILNAEGNESARLRYQEEYSQVLEKRMDILSGQVNSELFAERKKVIEREMAVVSSLLEEETEFQDDRVILGVLDSQKYFPFVYLLTGLVLVYSIIHDDHENHVGRMYNATKTQEKKRAFIKLQVIACILSVLYILYTLACIDAMLVTGADLSKQIQTVTGYLQYNIRSDILVYYIWLSGLKFLLVIAVLWEFVILLEKNRNIGVSLTFFVIVFIAEYLVQLFMSMGSPLAFLKSWNLYTILTSSMLDSEGIYPFLQVVTAAGMIPVLCFIVLLVYNHPTRSRHRKNEMRTFRFRTVGLYWLKNLLGTRKGIVILLAVFVYCLSDAMRYEVTKTAEALQYEACAKKYYGPIDSNMLDRLEADLEEMRQASVKAQEMSARLDELSVEEQEELYRFYTVAAELPMTERVNAEIQHLKDAGASYYADNTGLELLVNRNGSLSGYVRWVLFLAPVCIWIIAVISPVYRTGLWKMYYATKKGKEVFLKRHLRYFLFFGILMYGIVYGFHAYKIFNNYEVGSLAQTVRDSLGIASSLPLWAYLVLKVIADMVVLRFFELAAMNAGRRMRGIHAAGFIVLLVMVLTLLPEGVSTLLRYDFIARPYFTLPSLAVLIIGSMILRHRCFVI